MLALQKEEAHKMEKGLIHRYEQWKIQVRDAREQLKTDIPESQIAALVDILEKEKDDVTEIYVQIRDHITPSSETRRRVDACEAVTKDIIKIAYERMAYKDDFDTEEVKQRLRELHNRDYAHSVYGSTVSPSSRHSVATILAASRAEAAAELAAKEAEYTVFLEEEKQRAKIQRLEEQQKRNLEDHKRKLERLKVEKNVKAARARLSVYNQEVMQQGSVCSADVNTRGQKHASPPQPVSSADVCALGQADQDSIAVNRPPVPEPSLFVGDPIQFIEWKASFMSLIDGQNISFTEKLNYLRKYVGGPARKSLRCLLCRNNEDEYKDSWERLDHSYGRPFAVQRAFREKLASWPKIQSKDAEGIRAFADFLHACQEAMPHAKGLGILNDREENQKLVHKLPDWEASRWNHQATRVMRDTQEFPKFKDFVTFMEMEAEVACNPITSSQEEKNVRAARARLSIGDQEVMQQGSVFSAAFNTMEKENVSPPQPVSSADVCALAQADQDSIAVNRPPVPEPSLFVGDPIQFIEWKASFMSLIDGQNISFAEKLQYLRKYVGGPALKTFHGTLCRSLENEYKDAWDRLDHTYGRPIVVQRAFRGKLAKWPKIQSNDAEGLRAFADFLHACQEAMPHAKGLGILNDREENQKLVRKLPDWEASRWNHQATGVMRDTQEFPKFKDFVTFMEMEAEVACQ